MRPVSNNHARNSVRKRKANNNNKNKKQNYNNKTNRRNKNNSNNRNYNNNNSQTQLAQSIRESESFPVAVLIPRSNSKRNRRSKDKQSGDEQSQISSTFATTSTTTIPTIIDFFENENSTPKSTSSPLKESRKVVDENKENQQYLSNLNVRQLSHKVSFSSRPVSKTNSPSSYTSPTKVLDNPFRVLRDIPRTPWRPFPVFQERSRSPSPSPSPSPSLLSPPSSKECTPPFPSPPLPPSQVEVTIGEFDDIVEEVISYSNSNSNSNSPAILEETEAIPAIQTIEDNNNDGDDDDIDSADDAEVEIEIEVEVGDDENTQQGQLEQEQEVQREDQQQPEESVQQKEGSQEEKQQEEERESVFVNNTTTENINIIEEVTTTNTPKDPSSLSSAEEHLDWENGVVFTKYGRWGKPHKRVVFLSPDKTSICWGSLSAVQKKGVGNFKAKSIALCKVLDVTAGCSTAVFRRYFKHKNLSFVCLSLISSKRTLDLQCDTIEQRDSVVASLKALIEGF